MGECARERVVIAAKNMASKTVAVGVSSLLALLLVSTRSSASETTSTSRPGTTDHGAGTSSSGSHGAPSVTVTTPADSTTPAVPPVPPGAYGGPPTIHRGMALDRYGNSAVVIDASVPQVDGEIALGSSPYIGTCEVTPDGRMGFVSILGQVWFIDLQATPPVLAPGTNPLGITNSGQSAAVSLDGRYAILCDGYNPAAIVDIAARAQIGSLPMGENCGSLDVCLDGSVLIATQNWLVRFVIDDSGHLSDTGERMFFNSATNVVCAPDGYYGIALSQRQTDNLRSFRVSGLVPVSSRTVPDVPRVSLVVSRDGTQVFTRSFSGPVDVHAFNPVTGILGTTPIRTLPAGNRSSAYGYDQLALDTEGTQLFVTEVGRLRMYDAATGVPLPPLTDARIQDPTGVCFGRPADGDRDGLSDEDEIGRGTDPGDSDTDGDGLLDGFEVHHGLNPIVPGEGSLDPDADGLDNGHEQSAHTDPQDPDSDDDGVLDGAEASQGTDALDADTDDDSALDGADNCPTAPNSTQSDAVHPGGRGDACDDPDGDGVFDDTDNCPDTPNSAQFDNDEDGLGDACDPYPTANLQARAVTAEIALTGVSTLVTYRLEDRRDGGLLDSLTGVRLNLTSTGSALFGSQATRGQILSGGGTNRALVQFVNGLVTLPVSDVTPERVILAGEDTQNQRIFVLSDVVYDFEPNDGGFTHDGYQDVWEWGVPTSGPARAFSGQKLWATNLSGDYPNGAHFTLYPPSFRIPADRHPSVEMESWISAAAYDTGYVIINIAGQGYWTPLGEVHGVSGGYVHKSYSLASFAGQQVQIGLDFLSSSEGTGAGWYVDDVAVRGLGGGIEFLDGSADADGDGLSNAAEVARGTDPHDGDTDEDGIGDAQDNCGLEPNPTQADRIHPGGAGDACDDPDADGIFDAVDNCPDAYNDNQQDSDQDARGDACDPFPFVALLVQPQFAEQAILGSEVSVTYRLVDIRTGQLQDALTGVRATLTLTGSAVFGDQASHGTLLAGGGTPQALVEFSQGVVVLPVVDSQEEAVVLGGADTDENGIAFEGDVSDDFEASDGEFARSGLSHAWQWGVPTGGPGHAASGQRVWATRLDGIHPVGNRGSIVSPPVAIPLGRTPSVEFKGWIASAYFVLSTLDIGPDPQGPWTLLDYFSGPLETAEYERHVYPLASYAGSIVRFRFHFENTVGDSPSESDWYIDDFAVHGLNRSLEFLSAGGDADADGLNNADEITLGTDPRRPDSDADGLSDGAEVHTHGTDPRLQDTDAGGAGDGREVALGANPLDARDDVPIDLGVVVTSANAAVVIDPGSLSVIASVPFPVNYGEGACVVNPVGETAFATSPGGLFVLDLAATPPGLASGTNPIPRSSGGTSLALTPDARFLLSCGTSISVVDTASREEVRTYDAPGGSCESISVCPDGSVLVSSNWMNSVHRLSIDSQGNITDTGESLFVPEPYNVYCSPDGHSGVVVGAPLNNVGLTSFRVPGLEPSSVRFPGPTGSGVFSHDGRSFFVITELGLVAAYGYDQETATLGDAPSWVVYLGGLGHPTPGVQRMALDSSGGALFVSVGGVKVYDPATGAPLGAFPPDDIRYPAGICFRSVHDSDGDGLSDDHERRAGSDPNLPDTDGDGLLDGFEVRYGFDPRHAGEQTQDPDGDGLDNLGEQAARTDPRLPDTDHDGLSDGAEIAQGTDPLDIDTDDDAFVDGYDNCPTVPNPEQGDAIHPGGGGDACDDPDDDGFADASDNCPDVANPDQSDTDAGELRQWATSATASSQFSPTDYSAHQATGQPNTLVCGDYPTAWAPATDGTGEEWLETSYPVAVKATGVVVHETYLGSFVHRVDLVDVDQVRHTLWTGTDTTPCAGELSLRWDATPYFVRSVRVYTAAPDFEEIDAVELSGTGVPAGGGLSPDGIGDACDNCPATYNHDQQDTDMDGIGDACECDYVTCAADACRAGGECDSATGSCLFTNAPDGTTCDDGNRCTRNDACLAGDCAGRPMVPKVDCDDHNRCTLESCDPEIGCLHSPVLCRDGDPDTVDSCDPRRGCVFTRIRRTGPSPLMSPSGM